MIMQSTDCRPKQRAFFFRAAICVLLVFGTFTGIGLALTMTAKVTTPAQGPVIWAPIPDPKHPGKFIPSTILHGTVLAASATGSGARTVTWSGTRLSQGYYKIEILYPKHAGNAKGVLVQYKSTMDAGFGAFSRRLNQQVGDGDQIVSNVFTNTSTNVTPYKTSNAASYVWVNKDGTNKENTGSLSVRLSDGGWGTPAAPGGRIVADTVRITIISTVR